jgi:eukaryotic-like serine/threonine-protein kinase
MALAPNSRFGPYEVLSALGAGGMGEVYRARDSKLHRDVALKVLPADVANDADRLARFRREAQLLAALNHPNIAHVYGLEEADGATALVMELVPGEDLAKRIAHGPIPVGESVAIAKQIAIALEAAHEAGIIHRDLKPANIKVSDDGTVKVLDFGLAKAIETADGRRTSAGGVIDSPTITTPAMTQAGMILGTAAYMAPEQAKGRPVDKRADVWAFGCVLYEMLTGTRAFEGEDVSDTLASILRAEPDWSRLPATVPDSVRQLIRGCLEKDRRARVPDIGVVRYLLDGKFSAAAAAPASAVSSSRWRVPVLVGVTALVTGAVLAMLATRLRPVPVVEPTRPARFAALPDPPLYVAASGGSLAISADASIIVYSSGPTSNDNLLTVRPLDALTGTRLDGTLNGRFPFISPDNKWIGYFVGDELRKIAITGGAPIRLCSFKGLARGGTWGPDGNIVFGSTLDTGLMQVSAAGGEAKPITQPFSAGNRPIHMFPSFLPGGESLLFTSLPPGGAPAIARLDLTTGSITTIQQDGGYNPTYLPSGHLVFDRAGRLQAVPFDLKTGTVSGDAVSMVSGLFQTTSGFASFGVSQSGVLIYEMSSGTVAQTSRTLVWVDRQGVETPLGVPTRSYEVARVSPDGTRIVMDSRDEEGDIWIWDTTRRALSRLTVDASNEMGPSWSSDGAMVYYSSNRSGVPNIFRQRADGAGDIERLTDSRQTQFLTSIGPGTQQLLFFEFSEGNEAIASAPITGVQLPVTNEQILIKIDNSHRFGPEISPDGRWLALHSNESGRYEVYVRPFPNVDSGRWQISSDGGTRAAWSRDGKELFYLDANGLLTSVRISVAGDKFSAGTPTQVLKSAYVAGQSARGLSLRSYDVSADGKRFLMVKDVAIRATNAAPAPMIVVTQWLEELKQRATPR